MNDGDDKAKKTSDDSNRQPRETSLPQRNRQRKERKKFIYMYGDMFA